MPEFVTSVTNGIKQTWSGLNKTQQRVVVLGGAVALVILIAVVMYSTIGPDYEILWSNLDPADAGTKVSELEKQNVPMNSPMEGVPYGCLLTGFTG